METDDTQDTVEEKMDLLSINPKANRRKPTVIIFVGLAGTGKTSLLQGLLHHIQASKLRGFVVNLDLSAPTLPFDTDIDIRDFLRYEKVMTTCNAGPSSAILTSLARFALELDEIVLPRIEKKADELDYVLVDTPGLVEAFWSSLGDAVVDAFASSFPTVVTYVADANSCANPVLLMSMMFYARSMFDKLSLPPLIAFNKIDEVQQKIDFELVENFISKVAAGSELACTSSTSAQTPGDKFCENLRSVWVSAVTGAGMDAFKRTIGVVAEENMKNYKADYDRRQREEEYLDNIVISEVCARVRFQDFIIDAVSRHWLSIPSPEHLSDEEDEMPYPDEDEIDDI